MRQIALPLGPPPADGEPALLVSDGNRALVEALAGWQRWPFGSALLVGPPRSGKSLMGRHFARTSGGDFVDDADTGADEALFHHWNQAREAGRPILFASRKPPAAWNVTLPDLRSRLGASALIEVPAPDEALVAGLIEAGLARRGLAIAPHVMDHALARIERSHAAAEALVVAIDRLGLERKAPAGLGLVRDALAEIGAWAERDQPELDL